MKKYFLLPRIRRGINHPLSFSLHLTRNFVLSTFIPFAFITYVLARIITQEQTTDMLQTTQSHLDSLSRNVGMYLTELQQVTLMPYYDENFSLYLSQANAKQRLSYLERQKIRQSLGNMINFIRVTRSDFQNVIIVNGSNCLYYSTALLNTVPVADYSYADEPWYEEAVSANGRVLLLPIHTPAYFGDSGQPVFSLVRSLVNLNTRIPYAVIKVDVPVHVFDSFLKDVNFYVDSSLLLVDEKGNLIYTNHKDAEETVSILPKACSDKKQIKLNGKTLLHESIAISPYEWKLHVFMDTAAILKKQRIIWIAAFSLYMVGVVLALLSYLGISRNMMHSIHSISECLCAIKNGDFHTHYVPTTHDELAFLGESVNDMGQQLHELIQREYVSTLQRKEAEMHALQSQIRPHFLFNTIGSLIALNQLKKTSELEEALFTLSSLLRYVVDEQTIVSLDKELDFCQHYFMLQKLRFGPKITYSIDCPKHLKHFRLPRLLLQPYIENAVIHGIEPCEHNCTICISVSEAATGIYIKIQDDGVGFQNTFSDGIGIKNSKKRLQTFCAAGEIAITSEKGQGCCVTLEIKGDCNEYTDR